MADNRLQKLTDFLKANGYADYDVSLLAGDASFRKYYRVTNGKYTHVTMDAPPEFERLEPFMKVDRYLNSIGLNAPDILAEDLENGFLLLEDFGDMRLNRLFASQRGVNETAVYQTAVEVLLTLQRQGDAPDFPKYTLAEYTRELSLFTDWYLPNLMPEPAVSEAKQPFIALWRDLLMDLEGDCSVLVLRDYHADNLMWPEGSASFAPEQLGLLDFQDALIGHPAYDLVSLLEDARRDVPLHVQRQMLDFFCKQKSVDQCTFERDYAILGAQRNFKILGIFLRLAKRDSKTSYLEFVPRVWGYLQQDLAHEALAPIQQWMEQQAVRLITMNDLTWTK